MANSENPRPIYPKAPEFSLSTFSVSCPSTTYSHLEDKTDKSFQSKDFIVKDFIEGLTESSIPVNRRSGAGNSNGWKPHNACFGGLFAYQK